MKRLADLIISIIALIILLPLLLLIYSLIFFDGGSPIFKQIRIGKNKKYFCLYKFRTMVLRKENFINQFEEPLLYNNNDLRITYLGKFLRSSSLDELPQLFNVLIGNMSIIGPRPIIPEQLKAIPPRFLVRFEIKPGITGLAQVNGRRSLGWFDQLKFDEEYTLNSNYFLDFKILILTYLNVIKGKNIYATPKEQNNWRDYLIWLDSKNPEDSDLEKFNK